MKTLILSGCMALLFATACTNSAKREKTTIDSATNAIVEEPMDSAAMMKAWEAYMTPGDAHKMLAKYNGTWDAEVSHWMKPDAAPTVSKASCINKMILGGRYQQSTFSGNFEGMPFEGIGTLAYDNTRKTFLSTWVDNMGTGVMYLEGTYDEPKKLLTLKGKTVDPASGKEMQIIETTKFIDDNNQYMEMFDASKGKEIKTMAIKFTRRK